MNDDVISLTQQLVRIPSVNPMGRDLSGPDYFEGRVTDFLQQWAERQQLPWERHTVFPDRQNLLIRLDGRGPTKDDLIVLEVHQDTVPVDGMTIPPFAAQQQGDRLYGRGSCDVKGGMATLLTCVARLRASGLDSFPSIVLAFTVNEENGFDGVRHACTLWQQGTSRLLPRRPDFAIVAEPTELDVVVAHKGTVRWKCHTLGRAAHSSDPSAGDNAIYRMQPVVRTLEEYANRDLPGRERDPLLGQPTLSVGTIQGGLSVNTVPDRCTIEIDRRLLPGEPPGEAYDHICRYIADSLGESAAVHDEPYLMAPGLPSGPNQRLAEALSLSARQHGGQGKILGVPFGTDAAALAEAGVPCVVFGPGSIRQAHTKDEWIDVNQLRASVEILAEFCVGPMPIDR